MHALNSWYFRCAFEELGVSLLAGFPEVIDN
jgi:hypothetical protein